MTKEDIDKAAESYEDGLIYSSIKDQCDIQKAFKDGANWRINSVWHKDIQNGKIKKPILVKFNNGLFDLFEDVRVLKDLSDKVSIFAYIEDLLPIKE